MHSLHSPPLLSRSLLPPRALARPCCALAPVHQDTRFRGARLRSCSPAPAFGPSCWDASIRPCPPDPARAAAAVHRHPPSDRFAGTLLSAPAHRLPLALCYFGFQFRSCPPALARAGAALHPCYRCCKRRCCRVPKVLAVTAALRARSPMITLVRPCPPAPARLAFLMLPTASETLC